jgi:hypothetical protein
MVLSRGMHQIRGILTMSKRAERSALAQRIAMCGKVFPAEWVQEEVKRIEKRLVLLDELEEVLQANVGLLTELKT